MTFNSIRIGDTASETYLISKYYDDAIKDCNETFITTHFQKDGTMFLFIYKNGVSEEDIISFNSKPLECYKSKLPSGIQLLTMILRFCDNAHLVKNLIMDNGFSTF